MLHLGMTATAAAAHEHDSSSPLSSGRTTPKPATFLGFPLRFMPIPRRETRPPTTREADTDASTPTGPSEPTSPIYSPRGSIDAETGHGNANDGARQHKHAPRPKTSFRFAHPPPGTRPKRLRIRPRLLLQLHKVSQTVRPVPTLDVVPSSLFGQLPVTRRFTNSNTRERPGATDLIIVPSESYETCGGGDDKSLSSDEGDNDQRRPIARLCKSRKDDRGTRGVVEIYLGKEARWEVTPLLQGGYEFVATDEHGVRLCVRWILRTKGNRQNSNFASGGGAGDDRRFTFSVIDPRTRRHPIIAWMSRTGIDILDQYLPSVASRVASSARSTVSGHVEPSPENQLLVDTDDSLRTLAITTGLWIAFRETWSENPLSSDPPLSPNPNSPGMASIASQPGPSNAPRTSEEQKRTEKNGNRNSNNVRMLSGSHCLHRPTSATAESWRSAKSPGRRGRSTDSANGNANANKPNKQPSRRISFVERVSCMMGGGGDDSDGYSVDSDTAFRSLQVPATGMDGPGGDPRAQSPGFGSGMHVSVSRQEVDVNGNGHGHVNGKSDAGKAKKKSWRRISGWFGGKAREKEEKPKKKPH